MRAAARSLLRRREHRCLPAPRQLGRARPQLYARAAAALLHTEASAAPRNARRHIKFLVLDGYIQWGREDLEAGGAVTAGQLYANMLVNATPAPYAASYDLLFPADPDFEIPDLAQYHGVGWSGSSLAVHKTDDERIVRMSALARACFAHGVPQFGSCFGAQLAVAVSGGVVQKNKFGKELGIARKIQLTPAGRAHPLYDGKASVFGGFTSHNDEVTHLRPGTLALATNAHTSVQAVTVRFLNGDFWALQYHPEYDLHEIARLLYCRRKVSIELGFFRDMASADAFIDDLETLHADPSRYDLAWKYGIDHDVLDDAIRTCEVRNFVKHLVLPYHTQSLSRDSP